MKKMLLLSAVLLLACFASAGNAETTITVQVPGNTASLNLSDNPDSVPGEVVDTLTVGQDSEGFAHVALLRMPLPVFFVR